MDAAGTTALGTKDSNKASCGRPGDPKYSSCVGKPKPKLCGKNVGCKRPPQGTWITTTYVRI